MHTQHDDQNGESEYRYIEYETDHETISIIQDKRNQSGWIQSTLSVKVER